MNILVSVILLFTSIILCNMNLEKSIYTNTAMMKDTYIKRAMFFTVTSIILTIYLFLAISWVLICILFVGLLISWPIIAIYKAEKSKRKSNKIEIVENYPYEYTSSDEQEIIDVEFYT